MARVFEFGPFAINVDARVLSGARGPIEVPDKVFDIVALLARENGLVTKERLVQHVWHGAAIGDSNISQHLLLARRALGDVRKPYQLIKTVHGRGYRLIPEVHMRMKPERDDAQRAFRRITALQYVRAARHFARMGSRTSLESSVELCHAALALDRECSPALAQLALDAAFQAVCGYAAAHAAFTEGSRYAMQALAFDPKCTDARVALAISALFDQRAPERLREAIPLVRENSGAWPIAHVLRMLTELKERRTVEPANTSSLLIATYEAFASYHSGALHQARFRLEQIVATRPDAAFARILLGRALLAIKDYARARVHFETILFPRAPFAARFEKFHADAIGGLAYVAAREGDRFGAAALRDDLARRFHDQFYAHALAATALGDETGAAHILQSAAAMHDPRTFFAGSDPLLAQSAALAASS